MVSRTVITGYLAASLILICLLSPLSAMADDDKSASTSSDCSYDLSEMLALDTNSFDQDFERGWRAVADRDGCKDVAADLIRRYVEEHNPQSNILLFHEAQMRAMAGQTEQALRLFPETRKPASKTDRIGWNHYVDATIAFLSKDRLALVKAQKALAATPKPEGFNPVDTNGNPVDLIWPPNLNVVDGFLECFEKDYTLAYNNCSRPLLRSGTDPR